MKSCLTSVCVLVLGIGLAKPGFAGELIGSASSAGSSASSAGSASVRGSSDAISGSSDSSGGPDQVAAGQYRLARIEPADPQRQQVLLRLEPVAAHHDGFGLTLPAHLVDEGGLNTGDLIRVGKQDFGLSFTREAAAKPFFLVVNDAWELDLQTRRVTN